MRNRLQKYFPTSTRPVPIVIKEWRVILTPTGNKCFLESSGDTNFELLSSTPSRHMETLQ